MNQFSITKPALRQLLINIGGEIGLKQILADFYQRMAADIMIGFFFAGKDLDLIARQQASFLLKAMGATTSYSGKAPADAHAELAPILTGHFDRRLQLLKQTLIDFGVSEDDIQTWVAFENAFRSSIVIP